MCIHMSYFDKTTTRVCSSVNTGKGKSHCSPKKIVHGISLVKGNSNNPMEEYHADDFKKIKGHELGFFTIFYGYLGENLTSYLQRNLFQNFFNDEEFWFHPRREIIKAYENTDKAILREAPSLGLGSSTTVTTISVDGRKLLVANVGHSRAVLSKNGKSSQLLVNHEPSTCPGHGSIENRGKFISNMPGDFHRVDKKIVFPQAFGDKSLKSHLWSHPDVREDIYILLIITLLNAVSTPKSQCFLVFWILFENVMSLHRTKATIIGLLEVGHVNE